MKKHIAQNLVNSDEAQLPMFTQAQLDWLRLRFDLRPVKTDSADELRWKGAQRDVVETILAYDQQMREGKVRTPHVEHRVLD